MENQTQFVQFLIDAKRHTYAGDGKLAAPSRPGSKDLSYAKDGYSYLDTYLGDIDFIGEEAVWLAGKAVWGMNYCGVMLTDEVPAEFSHCLKGALLNVPREAPFRGPSSFRHGNLEYTCSWQGDVDRFAGIEHITLDGKEIYRLLFHGGSLR
jgi:hypothetical protein